MKKSIVSVLVCLLAAAMLLVTTACDEEEKPAVSPTDTAKAAIADIVGQWNEVAIYPRVLTVKEDGSFTLADLMGDTETTGKVKLEQEEHPDGSTSDWYNFYDAEGAFWAGFARSDEAGAQNDLYSGQDGAMHFMRDGIDEHITADSYLHVWDSERVSIVIEKEKKGYLVTVTGANSASESTCWTYHCTFDEKSTQLVCKGGATRVDIKITKAGKEKTKTVYKDGSGSFAIQSGTLRWVDEKENNGSDRYFVVAD